MTRRKKIGIGIGILLVGIILWQFGFFNRYNYLTAKIDIMQEQPRIIEIGILGHFGIANNGLNQKFGFMEFSVHSFVTTTQLRGIKLYNKEIEEYLNKRNGNDWRKKYKKGLDSIIKMELYK
jgi:hypothetical protein